uniref:Uncharacterized protein n=1 Tax=Panagrolaimus davidi TaxID=227884 RepID=A0A914P4J2_9BILA
MAGSSNSSNVNNAANQSSVDQHNEMPLNPGDRLRQILAAVRNNLENANQNVATAQGMLSQANGYINNGYTKLAILEQEINNMFQPQ